MHTHRDDPPHVDDLLLTCVDCHAQFIYTAGEQQFFTVRALEPPKRCKVCRAAKRQRYAALTEQPR